MIERFTQGNPDTVRKMNEIIEAGGTSNTAAASLALEEIRMAPEYREMYDRAFAGNRSGWGRTRTASRC